MVADAFQRPAQLSELVCVRACVVQHADECDPGVFDTALPVGQFDPGELAFRGRVPPVPLGILGAGPLHGSSAVGDLSGSGRPQQGYVLFLPVRRHQHRGQPSLLESLGPCGVLVLQQHTQVRQVAVVAVVLRGAQYSRPQCWVLGHLLSCVEVAGAHAFQRLSSRLEDDVAQGLPEGVVQPVGAELVGVEQEVVRLGASGGRFGEGEEFDQRSVRQIQTIDQRCSLCVEVGGELLACFVVRRMYCGEQVFLVQLGGEVLAPPGQPDEDLERLADAVGEQHGVSLGGCVEHCRSSAQEVRASGVVAGDRLQRSTGRQMHRLDVVCPVHIEIEGVRGQFRQVGAGAQEFQNAVGHTAEP